MKSLILLVIAAAFAPLAYADVSYNCDYAFMGYPTTSVKTLVYGDGSIAESVEVTIQGRTNKETATAEVLAADEEVHLWISKNTENEIEMIIYRDSKAEGDSKLVNHKVPFGKEMWGKCAESLEHI